MSSKRDYATSLGGDNFLARFVRAKSLEPDSVSINTAAVAAAPAPTATAAAPPRSLYEGLTTPKPAAVGAEESKKKVKRKKKDKVLSAAEQRRLELAAFHAAEHGDVRDLHAAFESGHDMARVDQYGWTLLMVAAAGGHMAVVKYLLLHHRHALSLHTCEATGLNATQLAARSGFIDVSLLIEHPPPPVPRLPAHADDNRGRAVSPWPCAECKAMQTQPPALHNTSIAHLVECGHVAPPRPYALSAANRGYQMLLRGGWDEAGLGVRADGRLQPVATTLRRDRVGVGAPDAPKARITHFAPGDVKAVEHRSAGPRDAATADPSRGHRAIRTWAAADRAVDRRWRQELS